MEKIGECSCGERLKIPKTQCLAQCTACKEVTLFLCHPIPSANDMRSIRCPICKLFYTLFACPKCQGCSVIKEFKSGQLYLCVCGFQTILLSCNRCLCLMCLPTRKNYEDTLITCKKCTSSFKYFSCPDCKQCMYLKPSQIKKNMPQCFNENCVKSKEQKVKQDKEPATNNDGKQNICVVCMNEQACMINISCYHMSLCQNCSQTINKCPICRTEGIYKKVFKN